MISVSQLREQLDGLSDSAEVRVDFGFSQECVDIISVFVTPEGDLVLKCLDLDEDDMDDEILSSDCGISDYMDDEDYYGPSRDDYDMDDFFDPDDVFPVPGTFEDAEFGPRDDPYY